MPSLTSLLGVCLAVASCSHAAPGQAASWSALAVAQSRGVLVAQSTSESITLLRFETQHYLVRVFKEAGKTYLNVYNKETGYTDINRALAQVAPRESEQDPWHTYVNQQGDLEYRARINREGQTELEIRLAGGTSAQAETGFNATYSFSLMGLGADLEATRNN